VSGQDAGIYDAMNKGVDLASGDWINFMNSGDRFVDDGVVESMFADGTRISKHDLIYGDTQVVYPEFGILKRVRAGSLNNLWKGMQFSHQSLFASSKFLKQNKFNPADGLAADFGFIYSAYLQNMRFSYVSRIVSSVSAGGASDARRVQSCLERLRIVSRKNGSLAVYLYYSAQIIRSWASTSVKQSLPAELVKKILQLK
jgi:glycosyltransferase involved in cell wall biosynthesis